MQFALEKAQKDKQLELDKLRIELQMNELEVRKMEAENQRDFNRELLRMMLKNSEKAGPPA